MWYHVSAGLYERELLSSTENYIDLILLQVLDACECRVSCGLLVTPAVASVDVRLLSFYAAKLLVRAFVSTRLDCCNSLLYEISDNLYRRLQAVQNTVARLITNRRRCEHITPVLQQLHWLPVRQRVHSRSPCWCTRHCTLLTLYCAVFIFYVVTLLWTLRLCLLFTPPFKKS